MLQYLQSIHALTIGGSRGGVRDARPPPLGVQILSISCSFRENLACSRPPLEGSRPPSGKSWIRHCLLLSSHLHWSKTYTKSHLHLYVTSCTYQFPTFYSFEIRLKPYIHWTCPGEKGKIAEAIHNTVHDLITFYPWKKYVARIHDFRMWARNLWKNWRLFSSVAKRTSVNLRPVWLKSNRSSLDKLHFLYFSIIILSQKAFEFMEGLGEFVRDKRINNFTWYISILPGMLYENYSTFPI